MLFCQHAFGAVHVYFGCLKCKAVKQVQVATPLRCNLHTAAPAYNADIASSWATLAHRAGNDALLQYSSPEPLPADCSQAVSDPASRKALLLPELQATPALQEPPCNPAAGPPGTFTAASHSLTGMLGHNQMRSPQNWPEESQFAQQKVATSGAQQPWMVRLHKQRAGRTELFATGQAPDSTAGQVLAEQFAKGHASGNNIGLSVTQQVPGSMAGQLAAGQLATGQVLGGSPKRFPQCAKQQHIAATKTQSLAALQRAADAVPSWAESTLPDHSGSSHHHGFLASAVMLETLGRQKQTQALSLHASCGNPSEEKGAMDPEQNGTQRQGSGPGGVSPDSGQGWSTPRPGQGDSSPASPTSHKWVHHSMLCIALCIPDSAYVLIVHHSVSTAARTPQLCLQQHGVQEATSSHWRMECPYIGSMLLCTMSFCIPGSVFTRWMHCRYTWLLQKLTACSQEPVPYQKQMCL